MRVDLVGDFVCRLLHLMPKRGADPIWAHTQDYWQEREDLPRVDLDADEFVYSRKRAMAIAPA